MRAQKLNRRSLDTHGHSKRLSFNTDEISELDDDTTSVVKFECITRDSQDSDTLLKAIHLVSRCVWDCLSEVLSIDGLERLTADDFLAGGDAIPLRPAVISSDRRHATVVQMISAFDRLIEESSIEDNLEESTMIKTVAAIHRTAVLLDLYDRLWLQVIRRSSERALPFARLRLLLLWAAAVDRTFDVEATFELAIEAIVEAERKQMSLADINRPFVMSGQRSRLVARSIAKLFLFGYWTAALQLLDRCYSYPSDEAALEFKKFLAHHFPATAYDLSHPESPRHPFANPVDLQRFRVELRTNFLSQIQISSDHLLRDILSVLADIRVLDKPADASPRGPLFVDLEDDTAAQMGDGPARLHDVFVDEINQDVVVAFIAHLFWFADKYEDSCQELDVADQNAVGYVFQRWWHENGLHTVELPSGEIAAALLIGNDVDKLNSHLLAMRSEFMPLTSLTMSLLTFFDFPLEIDLLRETFLAAVHDLADCYSYRPGHIKDRFKPELEAQMKMAVRPYALFCSVFASATQGLADYPQSLIEAWNHPAKTPLDCWVLMIAGNCLASSRSQALEYSYESLKRAFESADADPLLRLFASVHLMRVASQGLVHWIRQRQEHTKTPLRLAPPRYAFRAVQMVNDWLKHIHQTPAEVAVIKELVDNAPLREKVEQFSQSQLHPLRLMELASIAEFKIAKSGDDGLQSTQAHLRLLLQRTYMLLRDMTAMSGRVKDERVWELMEEITAKPRPILDCDTLEPLAITYCEDLLLGNANLSPDEICHRLKVLRGLRLCAAMTGSLPPESQPPLTVPESILRC